MLAEFGCRYAIVGHSSAAQYHGESDQLVAHKAQAALGAASRPSSASARRWPSARPARPTGVKRQLSAVIHQLAHCAGEMVVAYEPVWAIGTGRTADARSRRRRSMPCCAPNCGPPAAADGA